jgi:hypothetical protein
MGGFDRAFAGLADVQVRHPDIAIFGLLIPDIKDIERRPEARIIAQPDALADARHDGKAQFILALGRLVLDFNFDQRSGPPGDSGRLNGKVLTIYKLAWERAESVESHTKDSPKTPGNRAKDTKDTDAASGNVSFVALEKYADWLVTCPYSLWANGDVEARF